MDAYTVIGSERRYNNMSAKIVIKGEFVRVQEERVKLAAWALQEVQV